MIKLCNWRIDKKTEDNPRCWPVDPVSKFMFKYKDAGVISHILSFFGEKRGYGDLRGATKEDLLELGLQEKVLREDMNKFNAAFWGVRVDKEGAAVSSDEDSDEDSDKDSDEDDH